MVPYFNTSGPCIEGKHYLLPPARRIAGVMELIDQERFFCLVSGRQTGKTTAIQWLVEHHRRTGTYAAVYVDLQAAGGVPEVRQAMTIILELIGSALRYDQPDLASAPLLADGIDPPETALLRCLQVLATRSALPLVVFFDEADGLVGPAMVSLLTQLRAGYIDRQRNAFPRSVALVGLRAVRDYVLAEEDRRPLAWLGTASPFNVTAETQSLAPFTEAEVGELLAQHTTVTGQAFAPEAVARAYALSQGHPWLVNALADLAVRREVPDRTLTVTAAHIDAAREAIILERRTHIDSLLARLREPRVRRVLEPMLQGDITGLDVVNDDFMYLLGLGLLVRRGGNYEIANPIYREIIPRALSFDIQHQIRPDPAGYLKPDGRLDLDRLLAAFQDFWRKDGHLAAEGFAYREAGPHLMLMAFLQRVLNGGGKVEREYGLGRGALDLYVELGGERHAIEVKVRRDTHTEEDSLIQVTRYLEHLGLSSGYLVMFEPRPDVPWPQRLYRRDVEFRGRTIKIVGC
jgi:hypothetical protein